MNIILARDLSNVIGDKGNLKYNFKKDMAFFREKTTNNTIIFGYRSFLEIGKALPNRLNIVIVDKSRDYLKAENVIYVNNLQEAIDYYNENPFGELFVCGGKKVYDQAFERKEIKTVYLTVISNHSKGDTKVEFDVSKKFIEELLFTETDIDRNSNKPFELNFYKYKVV